ncbi:hypothetical protein PLICRDRAFT_695227 [Plicaturopsis crispa FD-325 SS-3]|nr:hypothetical protein PLICRDRAFT_695227 [Plicaturopsis crispa FD-325 SS-3]
MAPSDYRPHICAPQSSYPSNATPLHSGDSPPSRVLTPTTPRRARSTTSLPSQSSQSESTESTTSTEATTVGAYVPPSVVARLKKLDPDGPRCLVTNKSVDLDFAYCVPRNLDPSTLQRLEYSWNLEPQTLNTDTRYNVFPLDKQLHRLFDSEEWLLFPSEEVIRSFIKDGKMTIGPNFPHAPNGTYEYTLIAKKTMAQNTIRRAQLDAAASDQHVDHTYPFRTLGLIKSHINPCFVIWNAGKKLSMGLYQFSRGSNKLYAGDENRRLVALELEFLVSELHQRWSLHSEPLPDSQLHNVAIPSISSSRVTRRRRAAPPPRIPGDDGPRLNSRTLKAHKDSFKDQHVPWVTTVWHWIWACNHAINALEVDSLPNMIDEDEDIPDNYEFYLADDDAPDALQYNDSRERLSSIFDACLTLPPSTLALLDSARRRTCTRKTANVLACA